MFLQNNIKEKRNNKLKQKLCRGRIKAASTLLFLCLLVSSSSCFAQYVVSGNNRSSLHYRQIKTNRFHIVYPDFYEANAQKLAQILDTLTPIVGKSLNTKAPIVPILIHTRSSKSNGMTVWAPKRMEFWTTTPPNTYPYPYSWQLAIHEYRHSCQMQALDVGVTKNISNIFGEHIVGAICGLYIPYWFLEGDAVVAETALAPTGRGQTPEFNMFLKAQVLDKGRYKPSKMILGSMKDFVPNEYNLGYFLISYGREKYGKDIWGDCLNDIGSSWWKLRLWGTVSKKNIDINFNDLYNQTIDDLETKWIDEDSTYKANDTIKENDTSFYIRNKFYCSYKNPIQINDSTVIALKTSNYKTQKLVEITKNKEKTLLSVPYLLYSTFSYRDGKILYSQLSPHPRWQQEGSADIIEYDLNLNKYRIITSNATFFTPIYNPKDSSLIAAIMTDDLDNQSLTIISPNAEFFKNKNFIKKNKSVYIKSISDISTTTFSYPVFSNDGQSIYVIETKAEGKAIVKYNIHSGKKAMITPYSFDDIKYLKIFNDRLYFVKDVNNKYQLLSVSVYNSNDVKIHTNSRYGIDNYYIYDSSVVVSDYTANGYKIKSYPYSANKWDIRTISPLLPYTKTNQQQEDFLLTKTMMKDTMFSSKKYSRSSHLFNFHSWAPVFVNINKRELGYGASVFSQNLLSTSVLELGYKYNLQEKDEIYMHYTYSGFYPIIELDNSLKPRDVLNRLDSNMVKYTNWDELMAGITIKVPFSWTNRNFDNSITPSLYYSIRKISNDENRIPLTLFNSIGYGINFHNYSTMASNDLYPRIGHISTFKFIHTLTADKAFIIAASSTIFIPTPFTNHCLMFKLSFQRNSPNVYYFPNEVDFVRGVYTLYPKFYYGSLISYNFPLCYPDINITKALYIKRIVLRPFYNFGFYNYKDHYIYSKDLYQSYGSEIEAKIHVFSITIPVDIGYRLGYCPTIKKSFGALLFNIDL
jgi:hypothetical protein